MIPRVSSSSSSSSSSSDDDEEEKSVSGLFEAPTDAVVSTPPSPKTPSRTLAAIDGLKPRTPLHTPTTKLRTIPDVGPREENADDDELLFPPHVDDTTLAH